MRKIGSIVLLLSFSFGFGFTAENDNFGEYCKKKCEGAYDKFDKIYSRRDVAYNSTDNNGTVYQSCISETASELADLKLCKCDEQFSFFDRYRLWFTVGIVPIFFVVVTSLVDACCF